MSRRFALYGGRRAGRQGGGFGGRYAGGGGGAVDLNTYLAILATVLTDWRGYWTTHDAAIGPNPGIALTSGEVASWTDQRNGFTLLPQGAGQRPGYGADGASFSGRSVVKCAQADVRLLEGTFGSNMLEVGDRPLIIMVARLTATLPLAVNDGHLYFNSFAGQELDAVESVGEAWMSYINSGSNVRATPLTNGPIIHVQYSVPGTGIYLRQPGGTSTSIAGVANTLASAHLVLGWTSNVNIAEVFVFRNYIGDTLRDQLLAAIGEKWGIA